MRRVDAAHKHCLATAATAQCQGLNFGSTCMCNSCLNASTPATLTNRPTCFPAPGQVPGPACSISPSCTPGSTLRASQLFSPPCMACTGRSLTAPHCSPAHHVVLGTCTSPLQHCPAQLWLAWLHTPQTSKLPHTGRTHNRKHAPCLIHTSPLPAATRRASADRTGGPRPPPVRPHLRSALFRSLVVSAALALREDTALCRSLSTLELLELFFTLPAMPSFSCLKSLSSWARPSANSRYL